MITSLALIGFLALGTGLTPYVAADEGLNLPDALGGTGVSEARLPSTQWQRTGFLSKDSGQLCKIRNPRRSRDRPTFSDIPCSVSFGPKIVMAGNKPGHHHCITL